MSSTFYVYTAIIPEIFVGNPEAKTLITSLSETGLMQMDGRDVHFTVTDCDGEEKYCLSNYDLPEETSDMINGLLQLLIDAGKICLMYEYSWSSRGGNPDEEPVDAISIAETLSTLVLCEIIAKRLEISQDHVHVARTTETSPRSGSAC